MRHRAALANSLSTPGSPRMNSRDVAGRQNLAGDVCARGACACLLARSGSAFAVSALPIGLYHRQVLQLSQDKLGGKRCVPARWLPATVDAWNPVRNDRREHSRRSCRHLTLSKARPTTKAGGFPAPDASDSPAETFTTAVARWQAGNKGPLQRLATNGSCSLAKFPCDALVPFRTSRPPSGK